LDDAESMKGKMIGRGSGIEEVSEPPQSLLLLGYLLNLKPTVVVLR
jgi:hypothetical protein